MYLYTYGRISGWKSLASSPLHKGEDLLPLLTPSLKFCHQEEIGPKVPSPTIYPIKQLLNIYEIEPFGMRFLDRPKQEKTPLK